MLTEFYIEALSVDEDLADQVWEAWDKGEADDQVALIAWTMTAMFWCTGRVVLSTESPAILKIYPIEWRDCDRRI